jgi:hypothetical protein
VAGLLAACLTAVFCCFDSLREATSMALLTEQLSSSDSRSRSF